MAANFSLPVAAASVESHILKQEKSSDTGIKKERKALIPVSRKKKSVATGIKKK